MIYLNWAPDLAIAHWRSHAPAEEQARWAWVAEAPEGPRYDRFVRIDGAMCAQARTVWRLVDMATRRPQRVPDWVAPLFA